MNRKSIICDFACILTLTTTDLPLLTTNFQTHYHKIPFTMFMGKMDDLFGVLGGSLQSSITDSTMMWIVHQAMNKEHTKIKSNEGILPRLNGISKFYELAVIQLEACIKFVQEEADHEINQDGIILETNQILADLTEIRDRLLGRLKESDQAILDKDKELLKLRQALELKGKELVSLNDTFKVEDDLELSEDRDGNGFGELKQQVLNIKQQLEPDNSVVSRDVENEEIEKMGFDINILKETMDRAFGKMQDAIFLSEWRPLEKNWQWGIEKETVGLVIKGFLKDFEDKCGIGRLKQDERCSTQLSDHLSRLINEATSLRNDLESLIDVNEIQGTNVELRLQDDEQDGTNSLVNKSSVSLKERIQDVVVRLDSLIDCNSKAIEEVRESAADYAVDEQLHEEMRILKEEKEDAELLIMMMEETNSVVLRSLTSELDARMEDFSKELMGELENVANNQAESEIREHVFYIACSEAFKDVCSALVNSQNELKHCNAYSNERLLGEDIQSIVFDECIRDVLNKANSALVNFQNKLKRWNAHSSERLLGEDIQSIVFDECIKDVLNTVNSALVNLQNELKRWNAHSNERLLGEEIYSIVLGEYIRNVTKTANSALLNLQNESKFWNVYHDERLFGEEIFRIVFDECVRDVLKTTNSALANFQKESNFRNAYNDERLLGEDISTIVFDECVRDVLNTANHTLDELQETKTTLNSVKSETAKAKKRLVMVSEMLESTQLVNFEIVVHRKLDDNLTRLEEMKHKLDSLADNVTTVRKSELLYKEAFVRRCQNLQKAETEVDLLGDQVEILASLLEKIYRILHQYSPLLQQHFLVSDLLKSIQRELNSLKCS